MCSLAGWFESYLVTNRVENFSDDEVHIVNAISLTILNSGRMEIEDSLDPDPPEARCSILEQDTTVNSKIFATILFSRIVLKDIFAMVKNRDFDMIYLHQ